MPQTAASTARRSIVLAAMAFDDISAASIGAVQTTSAPAANSDSPCFL
jgi:hypothetical protein